MATHEKGYQGHKVGYIPANTSQGWGAATFICALTAALALSAFVIHKKTYKDPTDPRTPAVHTMAADEAPSIAPDAH